MAAINTPRKATDLERALYVCDISWSDGEGAPQEDIELLEAAGFVVTSPASEEYKGDEEMLEWAKGEGFETISHWTLSGLAALKKLDAEISQGNIREICP